MIDMYQKSIVNVKNAMLGLLAGHYYKVFDITKEGVKQELNYSPVKLGVEGIQDKNGNLRHVSTNHYFEKTKERE